MEDKNTSLAEVLIRNLQDVITIIDARGVILFQSPSLEDVFGHKASSLIGTEIFRLVHPEDIPAALVALQRTVEDIEDDPRFLCRFMHADGRWRWVEVIGVNLTEGPVQGVMLNTRDVTDRENALAETEQLRKMFEAAFNATNMIASVTRVASGEFLQVNDTWMKVTGWTREEAIGRTADELNVWGDPANRQEVLKAVENNRLRNYRTRVQNREGALRDVVLNAEILSLPDGDGLLLTGFDVTEQNVVEAQLRQIQRIEAVGQLTGGIAHDFNNLLSVISGNAELLGHSHDDDVRSSANSILRAARAGADLIQHLLTFSRRQSLNPEPFDIVARLQDLKPLLHSTLGKDIRLNIESARNHAVCVLDMTQFDSAILNLCLNARNAIALDGEIRISVNPIDLSERAWPELFGGSYVEVAVSDNGSGMTAETREHAFEPFYTTRPESGGTGLGLSMVYGFITQSGGQVAIDSEPGNGTTVSLILPEDDAATISSTPAEAESVAVETGPVPVVLVEDNPDVRQLVVHMLQGSGMDVTEYGIVDDALAHTGAVQLLITDLMLPGNIRGIDIADRLRARNRGLGVIYMSGFDPGELPTEELERQGVVFLQKPFTRQRLLDAVTGSLDAVQNGDYRAFS